MPVRLIPSPAPLEMLMMRPLRAAFIPGATACERKNAPLTFTSKMLCHPRRDLLERAPDLAEHAAGVVDEDVDAAGGGHHVVRELASTAILSRTSTIRGTHAPPRFAQSAASRELVFEKVAGPDTSRRVARTPH